MDLRGKRIAVYARYSTDKQNALSIEDQLRVCREYVERAGGTINAGLVFSDAAISGASTVRPGFAALQEAVRAKSVDFIVTEDVSRIGRDVGNNDRAFKEFKSYGARLLTLDGFDTGGHESNNIVLGAIKSAMGEMYLAELRSRTKRGMDGLFDAGQHTGGRVYGYRAVATDTGKKRLDIDEAQAVVVRRLFSEVLAGHSHRAVAQRLNADGVEAPRGGKWSFLTIRSMLRNELYAGRVVFNRRQWERDHETGKRKKRDRPRNEWRIRECPELRIVDADTWDGMQALIRAAAKRHEGGQRKKNAYPLSGLLACGMCGASMVIAGGGKLYQCAGQSRGHGCKNTATLRERDARKWIVDRVRDAAGVPALLDAMRADWAATLGSGDRAIRSELAERRAALTRTEGQVLRLLDWVADGNDSPAVRAKLSEKEDHAELQRVAIARLERELGRVPVLPSVEGVRRFLRGLPDELQRDPVEARGVLQEMIDRVHCTPAADGVYRLRFDLDMGKLLQTSAHPPVRNARSFELVAVAGFKLKRVVFPVDDLCLRGYGGGS